MQEKDKVVKILQSENTIARILRIIGVTEVVLGFIFACIAVLGKSGDVGLIVFISSFIACMLFMGFSETIELLQKILKTQFLILQAQNFSEDTPKWANVDDRVLRDIESDLPKM